MVALYREKKMTIDPNDPEKKKRIPVLDPQTGKPVMLSEWYARIPDFSGKRKKYKFTKNRSQSQKLADAIAFEQQEIRKRPVNPTLRCNGVSGYFPADSGGSIPCPIPCPRVRPV